MSKFERIVEFYPAFDKRDPSPSKDYGIGALCCKMILIKDNKAVQFYFSTGIYLPHNKTKDELRGYDLGYHAPAAQYEGQIGIEDCPYIKGKCYYDGSSLNSDPVVDILLRKGGEAVWKFLENYWNELFNNKGE